MGLNFGQLWDNSLGRNGVGHWAGQGFEKTFQSIFGGGGQQMQAPPVPAPPKRSDATMQSIAQQSAEMQRRQQFKTLFTGGTGSLDTPSIATALLAGY